MQVPIKRTIERVPGGMMIVPLFVGAIIRTLAPGTPTFFGSFTGALFTGALTILAVFYVCMGATIEFRATPYIVKKGGALFAAKVSVAVIAGIILGRIWGESPVTGGLLAGLSTLPFFAFALGANIDLAVVWKAGLLGVFLGIAVVIATGAALFLVDRLTGGNGIAGLAAASTAGNAAAVPAIVAAANPVYKPAAASATILVATSVVVTAILVPIVTAWWYRRVGRPRAPEERIAPAPAEAASV